MGECQHTTIPVYTKGFNGPWSVMRTRGHYEVYSKVFGGTSWGEDLRLTSFPEDESSPAIARTTDGTIWLTYTRGGNVFYITHQDGCWSAEAALPTGPLGGYQPSGRPSAAQVPDGRMWIAYDSNRHGNPDIYALRSNHSAAVTGVPDVDDEVDVLPAFSLAQSYPNPFSPSTTIRYSLPARSHVRLGIYDVAGREVAVIQDGVQPVGAHEVRWDGADRRRLPLSAGVYFVRLDAGGETRTSKMMLVR